MSNSYNIEVGKKIHNRRKELKMSMKTLGEKNYIAGFSCYVDRKKQYYYIVHDEKLTRDDFNEFIEETVEEIKEDGFEAKNIQPIKDCPFSVPEEEEASDVQNVQHSLGADMDGDVQFVQYSEYSTSSTVPDEQIQIHIHKEIEEINTNKEISVNTRGEYKNYIIDCFLENGDGLFSKEDILYFADKVIDEMQEQPTTPHLYFYSIINRIIRKRKDKLGLIEQKEVPFYNWLEN